MNKIYLFIAALILSTGCRKEEPVSNCEENMRLHFSKELKCTSSGNQTDLFRANYDGKTVYFPQLTCINCNVLPPQKGLLCDKTEVVFTDLNQLQDVEKVYDSCTRQYWQQ